MNSFLQFDDEFIYPRLILYCLIFVKDNVSVNFTDVTNNVIVLKISTIIIAVIIN